LTCSPSLLAVHPKLHLRLDPVKSQDDPLIAQPGRGDILLAVPGSTIPQVTHIHSSRKVPEERALMQGVLKSIIDDAPIVGQVDQRPSPGYSDPDLTAPSGSPMWKTQPAIEISISVKRGPRAGSAGT
jgi:hypothetical protein